MLLRPEIIEIAVTGITDAIADVMIDVVIVAILIVETVVTIVGMIVEAVTVGMTAETIEEVVTVVMTVGALTAAAEMTDVITSDVMMIDAIEVAETLGMTRVIRMTTETGLARAPDLALAKDPSRLLIIGTTLPSLWILNLMAESTTEKILIMKVLGKLLFYIYFI